MLKRRRFGTGVSTPADAAVARALLPLCAQDGSTTRLCETIAGGPIQLHVLEQRACNDPPEPVRCALPGTRLIERFSCLASRGAVMLDSLAYVTTQTLPRDVAQEIEGGERPIGHLLERLWIRRAPWARLDDALCARPWAVGSGRMARCQRDPHLYSRDARWTVDGDHRDAPQRHAEAPPD